MDNIDLRTTTPRMLHRADEPLNLYETICDANKHSAADKTPAMPSAYRTPWAQIVVIVLLIIVAYGMAGANDLASDLTVERDALRAQNEQLRTLLDIRNAEAGCVRLPIIATVSQP
jgi:hypothetical protein